MTDTPNQQQTEYNTNPVQSCKTLYGVRLYQKLNSSHFIHPISNANMRLNILLFLRLLLKFFS